MLLRHVVPNNGAPFAFHAITYAGETLDRLLAGVKGRRIRCHDSAAFMDARPEKSMADTRYSRSSVQTSSYKIQSRSIDLVRS